MKLNGSFSKADEPQVFQLLRADRNGLTDVVAFIIGLLIFYMVIVELTKKHYYKKILNEL